jgi:hypothetical protein
MFLMAVINQHKWNSKLFLHHTCGILFDIHMVEMLFQPISIHDRNYLVYNEAIRLERGECYMANISRLRAVLGHDATPRYIP